MDDLDRLFRRLVQNIRNGYPEYLSHPFEVAELYQALVPYRHNRRELAIETNQDYEVALCQLLAGERGYVLSDDEMRDTIQRELASPNPNTAIFREFAAARVSINPDAVQRTDESTNPYPMPAYSAAAAQSGPGGGSASASPPPVPRASRGTRAPAAAENAAARQSPAARDARPATPAPGPIASAGAEPESTPECRYCGGALPAGRNALFCPNCGQNLMVQRCPACGTELELNWKYCITCGRGVAAT